MTKRAVTTICDEAWLEISNIGQGVFAPLTGFMDSKDYASVVNRMRLSDGTPWTIPITLDVPESEAGQLMQASLLVLRNSRGEEVAEMQVEDVYRVDFEHDIPMVYGTDDRAHPGVSKECSRSPLRVGGTVEVRRYMACEHPEFALTPSQTRALFAERGWRTIAGFQTRNPVHRAHEYLQRVALEVCDGLLIQPLLGWKKKGDFTCDAILAAYKAMVEQFYPAQRVVLGTLWTPMRYAGPREAVFHAVIRKNFGCTHFIVGRDHAGIRGYYEKYAAHELCRSFDSLGIEILALHGPFYCPRCGGIATEKTCPHDPAKRLDISGTDVRALLRVGEGPPPEAMRKEVADVLIALQKKGKLFIE